MEQQVEGPVHTLGQYQWLILREFKRYEAAFLDARARLSHHSEATAALETLIRLEREQTGSTGKDIAELEQALALVNAEAEAIWEAFREAKQRFELYSRLHDSLGHVA